MAFDTSVTGSALSSPLTITTLTIAANSNRLLVVPTNTRGTAGISTVTWNLVGLTKAIGVTHVGADTIEAAVWYLIAPASGNFNIVITSAGVADWITGCGISLFDMAQTDIGDDTDSNSTGSGSSLSLAAFASITDNCDLVDAFTTTAASATMTAATGRVQRMNLDAGNGDIGAASTIIGKTPAGSAAMEWTFSAGERGALVAAAFKPVAGGDSVIIYAITNRTHRR